MCLWVVCARMVLLGCCVWLCEWLVVCVVGVDVVLLGGCELDVVVVWCGVGLMVGCWGELGCWCGCVV